MCHGTDSFITLSTFASMLSEQGIYKNVTYLQSMLATCVVRNLRHAFRHVCAGCGGHGVCLSVTQINLKWTHVCACMCVCVCDKRIYAIFLHLELIFVYSSSIHIHVFYCIENILVCVFLIFVLISLVWFKGAYVTFSQHYVWVILLFLT